VTALIVQVVCFLIVTKKKEVERGRGRSRGVEGVKIMVGDVVCSGEGAKVGGNANDVGGVADMVQSRKVSEKVCLESKCGCQS